MTRLKRAGRAAKVRHLKTRLLPRLREDSESIVVDPHGKAPRSALLSLTKIFVWVIEEWYARWFVEERDALLICDRYYHDLLVDPLRYRFGAPLWTARLVGRLMPEPNLWILLDALPEVLRARKQEVTPEETSRQCRAYREFVSGRRRHEIIDASQPLEKVIEDTEQVILAALKGA